MPEPGGSAPLTSVAVVVSVHSSSTRVAGTFAKRRRDRIELVTARGVTVGGATDIHYEVSASRQVHLVPEERYDRLRSAGIERAPGLLGENIVTRGIDLLGLGVGARLRIGAAVELEVTGLRHPGHDLPGAVAVSHPADDPITLGEDGVPRGRVGVFAVVLVGGPVQADDPVRLLSRGSGQLPPL